MFSSVTPLSPLRTLVQDLFRPSFHFAHDNLTPPKAPAPSPNLVFLPLHRDAERLRLDLALEGYTVGAEKEARLREVQGAARALPETTEPEERARLVEQYQMALDGLVGMEEALWLEWDGRALIVTQLPECLRLTMGVARRVSVRIRNEAQETVQVRWEANGCGEEMIVAGGIARFFLSVVAGADQKTYAIHFSCNQQNMVKEMPVRVAASGRVQVRVVDEKGEITASRVYVSGCDGRSYTPEGAIRRLTDMGDTYYHVPGEFCMTLPAGDATLEFSKGFEYGIARRAVSVEAGRETVLTVQLARWADMPAQGWFSGDGHIHMHYGGTLKVLPEEAMLMLQAEDVNVGNMVVANCWGDDVFDREHFEGATNRLSLPRHILHWSEEFRNDFLGHLILYNLKELTDPVYTGFANTPHAHDFPLNADICDQAIAQGGVATGAHPFWGRAEHAIDVALGKMAGIETAGYGALYSGGIEVLHGLWNCGYRTVATAGTDSFLNMVQRDPLGGARCYALLENGEALSYEAWVQAMEAGRTFVTTGPLLFLTVEELGPGSELRLASTEKRRVQIRARAFSQWPLTGLDVLYNGDVLARVQADGEQKELCVEGEFDLAQSGWIAAQCTGPHNRFIMGGSLFKNHLQVAHTSPVWVVVDGKPVPPSRDAQRFLKWVEDFARTVEEKGHFENEEQREHMRALYGEARERFAALAEAHRKITDKETIDIRDIKDIKG